MRKVRHCKDCPPESTRDARFPGPRCFTHHRDKVKVTAARQHARRTETTYNLTADQYAALADAQGGCCAICRRPARSKRLAVDHCHASGRVRGLLCGGCNTILLGRWSRDSLARAVAYLDHPPAPSAIGTIHVRDSK